MPQGLPAGLIGIEDVVRLARPSTPRVSPRGDVAFTVSRPDPERNEVVSELWVLWAGGGRTVLQGEGFWALAWSPAGDLAFASRLGARKGEKGAGVFLLPRGSGQPRRVAWLKHGVWGLAWLDDATLAAGSRAPASGLYDEDGDYVATDRLPLWFDGEGYVAGLDSVILAVDAWSGRWEEIAREEGVMVRVMEACGGRVYYAAPRDWRNPTMHDLKEAAPGVSPHTVAEGYSIGSLACVGGTLYATAHRGEIGIASHYKLHKLAPSGLECITCGWLDRNIWSVVGGLDGRVLVLVADSGRVAVRAVGDGSAEPVIEGDFWVHEAHAAGGAVAAVVSAPKRPPEVYLYRGGVMERLTRFNAWLEGYRLSEPKRFTVKAAGDEVEGWVLEPPEGAPSRGGGRPLILFIHGGPKGMYGYRFEPEHQLFAARGFLVVTVNPRGSDGYSEEFADIRGRYGEADYEQLMAAVDYVVGEYGADEARMAVTGISYGGYMTNVVVAKTDRFAAAVSENGIADWIADYWASDIGYWFDPDQIGGTPLDNLEEYVKRSPALTLNRRPRTPLLVIHSAEDYRCFVDQALAMHSAVLARGGESRLVLFTKGGHGHSVTAKPRHRRKRLELKVEWIEEKLGLKGGEGGGGSKGS